MPPLLRPVSGIYLLAGGVGLLVLTIPFMSERFLEVFVVLQSGFDLVKPPDDFSWEEISLFSGRLYLWSNYVYTWLHSSAQVHIIGFGPEAWAGVMPLYAHNTFVSYLYEFGFVGLMLLLVFFGTHVLTMTKVRPPFMAAKLTAALLGYLTLNLATMPLWEIEGVILLAILCATAWAILDGAEQDETTPAVPPTPTKRKPIGARWQRSPRGPADVGGTAPAPVERPAVVSGGNRRSVAAARARSSRKAGSPGARPG
jgi:hypothetical protein